MPSLFRHPIELSTIAELTNTEIIQSMITAGKLHRCDLQSIINELTTTPNAAATSTATDNTYPLPIVIQLIIQSFIDARDYIDKDLGADEFCHLIIDTVKNSHIEEQEQILEILKPIMFQKMLKLIEHKNYSKLTN